MNEDKPTIFITIDRGMTARDILLNDFFKKIKEKYQVVIFTPLWQDEKFLATFGQGVKTEPLKKRHLSALENVFHSLHKALIFNPTIKIRSRYGFILKEKKSLKKFIKYWLQCFIFGLFLSRIKFLRDWLRFLDKMIFNQNYYQEAFLKYQPIAVFLTNLCSDDEMYLLRSAKKNKVMSFGMPKSWDNFSKFGLREKTDKLIVWSEYMKDEAQQFQNYGAGDMTIIGVPQFDIYWQAKNKFNKKDFTQTYGLDENKKIILFGQGSPLACPDDPWLVTILRDWIAAKNKNYQILIRPHFAHRGSAEYFKGLADNQIVFIDNFCHPSNFKDSWDFSPEHQWRLALSVSFCDLIVTSASTLVLDAFVSDKGVLSYSFDQDRSRPLRDSVRRYYETLWFRDLKKHGFSKNIVSSKEELFDKIEQILERGGLIDQETNQKLIERFCYKADGQTGARLFDFIDSQIANGQKSQKFEEKWGQIIQRQGNDEVTLFVEKGQKPQTQRQFNLFHYFEYIAKIVKKNNYQNGLEVGCGRGTISLYLNKYLNINMALVDNSQEALDLAKHNFNQHDALGNFINADVRQMNFADNTFDLSVSIGLAEHFEDYRPVFAQQYRVLRPGGTMISLNIPGKKSIQTLNNIYRFFLRLSNKKLKPDYFRNNDQPEDFARCAKEVGFSAVETFYINSFPLFTPMGAKGEKIATWFYEIIYKLRGLFMSYPFKGSKWLSQAHFLVARK